MNRRRFLLAAAGAALGASFGRVPAAYAAPRAAARRAETYRALVRSLRSGGDPRFARAEAAVAYRRFTTWYRAQPPSGRAHAETILDELGRSGPRRATVAAALSLASVGCEPPLAEDERPDLPTLAPAR